MFKNCLKLLHTAKRQRYISTSIGSSIFAKDLSLAYILKTTRFQQIYNAKASSVMSFQASRSIASKVDATVEVSEIKFFTALREDWWNLNGKAKGLHAFNKIRTPFIQKGMGKTMKATAESPLKGFKILDIGCGGGILTEDIAKLGATVVGVDASDELLQCARDHAALNKDISKNTSYVYCPIEEHAKSHKEVYDGIIISEVIEHINKKSQFLESCIQTLKPGGSVFITTFNKTPTSLFKGIILFEYVYKAIPKGTHDWRMFISPEGISKLLEKYNCKTVLVKGIDYSPTDNEWFWTKNPRLSYGLHAVKIQKN